MENKLKRSALFLVLMMLVMALIPSFAFAADTNQNLKITFTGTDVVEGELGERTAYYCITLNETNTVQCHLIDGDGNEITEGVTWSKASYTPFGTLEGNILNVPEVTARNATVIVAEYNGTTVNNAIDALPETFSILGVNDEINADDPENYIISIDPDGKTPKQRPYINLGDYGNGRILDFSYSQPGIIEASYSGGSAIYTDALSPGSTVLTLSIKGHPELSVSQKFTVEGVSLKDSNDHTGVTTIYKGEKMALQANDGGEDSTFTWTSDNKTVATVNSEGIVTARKEGSAMIHATNADGKIGGIRVYVYENDKKPYLDDLVAANNGSLKLRRAGENGDWLNEASGTGSFSGDDYGFSRTKWNYGVYCAYSSNQKIEVYPDFDDEKYNLDCYVNNEKQDLGELASGDKVLVALASGETRIVLRVSDKDDANIYTEYSLDCWMDYSNNGKFSNIGVASAERTAPKSFSFTVENMAKANSYLTEGTCYSVNAKDQITTTTISNSYYPWYGVTGVFNSYLLNDVSAFSLRATASTEYMAYSMGEEWTTPENEQSLPDGWKIYDGDQQPVLNWTPDEGQDYMTIRMHTVSAADYMDCGWMAKPAMANATATNVSDREIRIYKLLFTEKDILFSDLALSVGGFMTPSFMEGSTSASAVIPADTTSVDLTLKATEGTKVYNGKVNDTTLLTQNEDGSYTLPVTTSSSSTKQTLYGQRAIVKNDVFSYTLQKMITVSLAKSGDVKGLPDKVTSFICPGSQYTNGRQTAFTGGRQYGIYPERTLVGSSEWTDVTSLGNFGGNIVWYFDDAVTNDESHLYGADFYIYGNSYSNGNGGFGAGETGQVWVSEDGKTWYALAGSEHFEDTTIWDYSLTYKNIHSDAGFSWTDNYGNSGTWENYGVGAEYPSPQMYPLFDFAENADEITLSGVKMPTTVHSGMFGYVDALASSPSYGSGGSGSGDELGTSAENPYASSGYASSFDLSWAVDAAGNPVNLENGIHYVKVQTAVFEDGGIMGEASTEVSACIRTPQQKESVGQTKGVDSIVISQSGSEKTFTLTEKDFDKVSDTVFLGQVDVETLRNLLFTVHAEDDDYIFVNNQSIANGKTTTRAYSVDSETPRMVRVMVQNGNCQPVSYYIQVTGGITVSEAVVEVENLITAIGSVSKDSGSAIAAARAAYDLLSAEDKAMVGNYNILVAAEENYQSMMSGELGTSDQLITVSVAMEKFVLGQGYIMEPILVTIPEDTNVAQLSVALLGIDRLKFTGSPKASFYLSSAADEKEELAIPDAILSASKDVYNGVRADDSWLGEFDYTDTSGWVYSINNEFPAYGSSECGLKDGDVLRWQFTLCGLGGDVGDKNSAKPMKVADKMNLTCLLSKVNALSEKDQFIADYATVYQNAMAALENWESSQSEVDNALNDLEKAFDEAISSGNYGKINAANLASNRVVANVIAQISDLPADITLDDKSAVEKARNDYEALNDEQKAQISADVLTKLTDAEAVIAQLEQGQADEAAVKSVVNMIEQLPSVKHITLTHKSEAEAARNAYESLSDEQKALVSAEILNKLVEVENRILELGGKELADISQMTDIQENDWYYGDVSYVLANGIFKGTSTTTFGPNEDMTRAMFVTVLGRYSGTEDSSAVQPVVSSFSDVDGSGYYASHVQWAMNKGVTMGVGNGIFGVDANISRQDMATMMLRYANAMGIALPEADSNVFFDDGDIADYAKDAVYVMKAAGVINGREDGRFDPQGACTRCEVAAMLHRFFTMEE